MKNTLKIILSGAALWLVGYVLGFVFYSLVEVSVIGWYILPFGVVITLVVLWKWVRPTSFGNALRIGLLWSGIAIVFDYFFLVQLLTPADGYYKADVYLYYLLTLLLPVGFFLITQKSSASKIDAQTYGESNNGGI